MYNDGEVRIGTKLDDSGFKSGAKELKNEAVQVDREMSKILSKSSQSAKGLGNALGSVAKKAIGLGSALFDVVAVGGALGALAIGGFILGKALDKANGKTEQLKANLSYIGFVASKIFENLLQPAINSTTNAVNGLVGALYKAVVYIGYILSKWTGKDLFSGTSVKDYAKSMESANKSAKGTAKATKQIKKDLMGFDEVNKLSDNTSSSSGGVGGGGVSLPNLPNLGDVKIPSWVEWIADHKDEILDVVKGLLLLLTFSKVISWLKPLMDFFGLFSNGNVANNLGLTGTQLGLIVGSLIIIGASIHKIKKDMDETYKKVAEIWEHGNDELDDWLKGNHTNEEIQDRLNQKQGAYKKILKTVSSIGNTIVGDRKEDYKIVKNSLTQQNKILDTKIELWRQGKLNKEEEQLLVEELSKQKDELERVRLEYDGIGVDTQDLYDKSVQYKDVLGEMGVKVQQNNKYMDIGVDGVDRFGVKMGQNKTIVGQVGQAISSNIKNATGETDSWYKKTTSVFDQIKQIANTKIPKKTFEIDTKVNTGGIGTAVNTIGNSIGQMISKVSLKSLFDDLEKKFPNGFSVMGFKVLDFKKIRKSLGLRQGGIINNPGRGVSLGGNIIGGEAGAEAVLPLDDTTMDRLGSAIARHMIINTTNINQINGRTLSREVKQIMNENEFANNI